MDNDDLTIREVKPDANPEPQRANETADQMAKRLWEAYDIHPIAYDHVQEMLKSYGLGVGCLLPLLKPETVEVFDILVTELLQTGSKVGQRPLEFMMGELTGDVWQLRRIRRILLRQRGQGGGELRYIHRGQIVQCARCYRA
mgnify:CR=1 FL=1